jgi:hypothetical protein
VRPKPRTTDLRALKEHHVNKISVYVIVAVVVALIGYLAFERSNASKLTGTRTSQHENTVEQVSALRFG